MSSKDDSTESAENYVVGNKSPPTHTQFKPGQSGNPKGRPKARRSFVTEILDELEELVNGAVGAEKFTITKRQAIAKFLVERALEGDVRVAMMLIEITRRADERQADEKEGDPIDDEEKQASMDKYVERRVQERTQPNPKESL